MLSALLAGGLAIGVGTLAACGTSGQPPASTAQPPASTAQPPASTAQPLASTAQLTAAGRAADPLVGPTSATFVSASTGWLIGLKICSKPDCSALELRKTTDGGRHWFPVTAPPAPALSLHARPDSVSQLVFANTTDGWAFDPGLWATHDGGASWHLVDTHGLEVTSLAASAGHAVAVLSPCKPFTACGKFRVDTAAVGSDKWLAVPGTAGRGLATVTTSGKTGYLGILPGPGVGAPRLLAGPVSGRARWRPLQVPCRQDWGADGPALGAAPRGTLVLACGSEPGAGNQRKQAYLSANDGRTWRRLANPPTSGYLGQVAVTSAGTIFISGDRSDVYISRDGGRSWHTSASLDRADIGDGLAATMVTSTEGFVLQATVHLGQIWLTYNDGRTWQPVSTR